MTAVVFHAAVQRRDGWRGVVGRRLSPGIALILILGLCSASAAPQAADMQPTLPLRAAFYYPWFPEAWNQQGIQPYTRYHPTLGWYDSSSTAVIQQHIAAIQYGGIAAGIASWWGQGTPTDLRLPTILAATGNSAFRWSVYHEGEGQGDPGVAEIMADLQYLESRYGGDPRFLRIGGRFVVFVYADAADGCAMADRWTQANTVRAFLVLKVFGGYRSCASQPDGWHQYSPAVAADGQDLFSYSISPGFDKVGEAPRLRRDLDRWRQNIRDMVASGAAFQLVTTFNEWGEGTAVESADEWASASGYGAYLDALHHNGAPAPGTSQPVRLPIVAQARATAASAVLVGAGDIADCDSSGDEATAALLDAIPGTVFTTGDNAYERGSADEYATCYAASWGRHKARTRPAVGNHEYLTPGAAGYFGYFGTAAGDANKGYYSYDLGAWHIVVLNSNCSEIGGCQAGSAQERWLRAVLAARAGACTLAYMHHPLWSSGKYQINSSVRPLYQALYDHGVPLVLAGHAHSYERFAPQDPGGKADPEQGIREIVVGTGGKNHVDVNVNVLPNSVIRNDDTFGVLKLTLHATSYEWEFVPEAGKSFTDRGTGQC